MFLFFQAAWQLRAITCIDLTTLAGDDTPANVARLCFKAAQPISRDVLKSLGVDHRGDVCFVWLSSNLLLFVKQQYNDS